MEEQQNDLQEEIFEESTSLENGAGETVQTSKNASFYERHKLLIWIVGIVLAFCMIYSIFAPNSSNEPRGIKVVEEQIVTSRYYAEKNNYIYPIVLIEIENTSNTMKKVSVEINFYVDGELLGSDLSDFVTLMPGDKTTLKAQSDKGYYYLYGKDKEYTYKITKWSVYDQ